MIYNVVMIPLAMGLSVRFMGGRVMTPSVAAFVMALSSVSVVLSSLSLKLCRKPIVDPNTGDVEYRSESIFRWIISNAISIGKGLRSLTLGKSQYTQIPDTEEENTPLMSEV